MHRTDSKVRQRIGLFHRIVVKIENPVGRDFSLDRLVRFPRAIVLHIDDAEGRGQHFEGTVNRTRSHGGFLGLLLTRSDQEKEGQPTPADMYEMGTVAKIVKRIKLPEGGESVFISTLKRFKVNEYYPSGPYLVASVAYIEDIEDEPDELRAWTRLLVSEMKQLTKNNHLISEEMRLNMENRFLQVGKAKTTPSSSCSGRQKANTFC